mmetsp:Transcript_21039/g.45571  ORF Transcript_21039/g.45571 Transcript_21039/m.45571 type:complete len:418 (-) Transcript_21039:167-1420(-)|eukprot:CAMPEP_0206487028 /NCGR_PEP_ID=MMETSP0324_2-20121206/41369_1 /ASSEMBLY_ACC=CAM_ASM_000836 /TAXON_ID=2866 /ORGANISM="Crypthecodinium cohnii, Strain Seligo" /LENGTH=417 /DNA_ID=CAMNT_0053965375 /DNA_START=121 /DNA_END=1374 /DNA_ORIENTATION=+
MTPRELDVVVFGATGFTGKQVVKQLSESGAIARWAVGGRRQQPLAELAKRYNAPGGVVVSDVNDPTSLLEMARNTRLVLNTTGPYRFFGEAVVKACIEAGADYIDLCGEPEFMEAMLLKHQQEAVKAGVIICHACAFDSVPADLGIWHCAELFRKAGGECGHVELFHEIDVPLGYTGHVTTFEAAVHGVGSARNLHKVRKELDGKFGTVPKATQILGPLPKHSGAWFWEPRLQRYALPFIGSDASVVRSSRRTMSSILNLPGMDRMMPQFGVYFTLKSRWSLFKMALAGSCFNFLAQRSWGRQLLLRFPRFFTMGAFSPEGPSKVQMENNKWIGHFFAAGLVKGERKEVVLRAELHDPGYLGTALLFVLVAKTLLEEKESLTAKKGVLTPAALLHDSKLLHRMSEHGVNFKIEKSDL